MVAVNQLVMDIETMDKEKAEKEYQQMASDPEFQREWEEQMAPLLYEEYLRETKITLSLRTLRKLLTDEWEAGSQNCPALAWQTDFEERLVKTIKWLEDK